MSGEKAVHMYVFLLLTFNLLKSGARPYFSVEERICERSLRQYFFPGDMKIFIY